MRILHIDSSIQGDQSISRQISAAVVQRLTNLDSRAQVVYRDLVANPLPHFSIEPVGSDAQVLTRVLEEVLASDVIVIGAPMYNFSLPSQLKSWIDAIVIPGRTFEYGADGVRGLLASKRVVIASSRGGVYVAGTPAASLDHQESLLRDILGFLGVMHIETVRAEGVRMGQDIAARALTDAFAHAASLAQAIP
ncbi:NAD(P)H-dependent oxidoreductase [Rhodanobacter sp. Root561]|uniref:FMN-dependent NADH-azoreductase n=1 Tax=Rhodanobacter sp. Root561 TaxID=1736560 RepID=UPI0009E6DCF1|nr:NAD(P)H-dependent oxidoreductase [Rhodanobacter sp. Root561]